MEGKELLYKVIDEFLSDINYYDKFNYQLYSDVKNDYHKFKSVPNDYLTEEEIIFKESLNEGTDEINEELIGNFLSRLETKISPKLCLYNDVIVLKKKLENGNIIDEINLIENIVKYYNFGDKEKNLSTIMSFVLKNNTNIQESASIEKEYKVEKEITSIGIDDKVMSILNRLEIDYKNMPYQLIHDLKKANISHIVKNYELIKKNKIEDYGLLHLIDKDNKLVILSILVYASNDSIKTVTNILNTPNLNVEIVKKVLNNIPTIFFEKNYYNFVDNFHYLKRLIVNYNLLLDKCPSFFLINHELLKNILKELDILGYNEREIVNKLYKPLTYNPYMVINNARFLNSINMEPNYNLLKVYNLENRFKKGNDPYKMIVADVFRRLKND